MKDLQDLARLQEAVNMQVKAMDQSSGQVNAFCFRQTSQQRKRDKAAQGGSRENKPGKLSGGFEETKVRGCFRCRLR